jgi:hypothetical protein
MSTEIVEINYAINIHGQTVLSALERPIPEHTYSKQVHYSGQGIDLVYDDNEVEKGFITMRKAGVKTLLCIAGSLMYGKPFSDGEHFEIDVKLPINAPLLQCSPPELTLEIMQIE